MAGVRYVAPDRRPLRGEESQRLAALAVPPAYEYAADQSAHIQTNGRDAGRLQYRYHPGWRRVREMRKTWFARLAEVTRIGCSRPPIAPELLAERFRHAHAAKSFVQELAYLVSGTAQGPFFVLSRTYGRRPPS